MRAYARLARAFARLLAPLGLCGMSGLLAGLLVGFILMLLSGHEELDADLVEGIAVAALLGLFAWIALIFVLTVLMRLTFGSVAAPALVNALLVAALTTAVALGFDIGEFAVFFGALIGVLVGAALCRLDAARKGGRG